MCCPLVTIYEPTMLPSIIILIVLVEVRVTQISKLKYYLTK